MYIQFYKLRSPFVRVFMYCFLYCTVWRGRARERRRWVMSFNYWRYTQKLWQIAWHTVLNPSHSRAHDNDNFIFHGNYSRRKEQLVGEFFLNFLRNVFPLRASCFVLPWQNSVWDSIKLFFFMISDRLPAYIIFGWFSQR